MMIGAAGIISNEYSFINDLFLFLFLFFLTVKVQKEQSVFLSMIVVVTPFLIVDMLSSLNSKLIILLLNLNLNITMAIIVSEIMIYIAIYLISFMIKKKFIPFIQLQQKEKIISIILTSIYVLRQSFEVYSYYFGKNRQSAVTIIIILTFAILIYLFMQSVSTSQELKLEVEKQKIEVKYMNEYAKETTKQYNEIRKFRHDYVNILSSLDYFIQTNDMEKLATYYKEFIQPTQESLSMGVFNFQELKNIQSDEIKSILAIKLLSAREKEIDVHVEIPEIIPKVLPVNPVTLIRMLGIILDNSIEEVSHIGKGKIEIGLFDVETHYLFIIKNSIREDIAPLHKLETEGYSTKGENRGLGLSNLNELSSREPHLTLETDITTNEFIQKIALTKGEG